MFRLLVLFASYGSGSTVLADPPPDGAREWTNATGTKHVHAVLFRVDDDQIWLRKANGQLGTTKIIHLSERDKQYIASHRRQNSELGSASLSIPASVVESVSDYARAIQELPQRLSQSPLGTTLRPVPAGIVYIRISKGFLEDYIERSVRQRKDVRDCILGTRIVGSSFTEGNTRLRLLPSDDQLRADIGFDGTVRASTRGYKGPITLHSISDSTFRAHKLIGLDETGLHVAPAVINTVTRLRTNDISTSLPRLRGRIATKIAWRRVSEVHHRSEAITSDHTGAIVRSDFDKRINKSIVNVQDGFGSKVSKLEFGASPVPTDVRFRSRTAFLEMSLVRENASAGERKLRPPPPQKNSDISLRVHRTVFTSAVEDAQLIQNLAPLFSKLLEARANQGQTAGRSSAPSDQNTDATWAIDTEWVSLDFKKSKG